MKAIRNTRFSLITFLVLLKLDYIFHCRPILTCRSFVDITTFSAGLVGCRSFFCLLLKSRDNDERPTGKNTTIEWDDGEKGNPISFKLKSSHRRMKVDI